MTISILFWGIFRTKKSALESMRQGFSIYYLSNEIYDEFYSSEDGIYYVTMPPNSVKVFGELSVKEKDFLKIN